MSVQSSPESARAAITNKRNPVHATASPCRLALAARGLWPAKTAEHLAAVLGKSPRQAAYFLAGRYEINGKDAARLLLYITQ